MKVLALLMEWFADYRCLNRRYTPITNDQLVDKNGEPIWFTAKQISKNIVQFIPVNRDEIKIKNDNKGERNV